jgi:dienelactone hydrolase
MSVHTFSATLPSGDEADFYLPRIARSANARRGDGFPLVALLQGAFVDKAHYADVARGVARRGFVVVVPNHFRAFGDFPEPVLLSEVNVVTDVFEAACDARADRRSPLHRLVDTDRMGLIGHSLGGSVGLHALAGEGPPGICSTPTYTPPRSLRAAAVYGTSLFDIRSGRLIALNTAQADVALIQGSRDAIAAPDKTLQSYAVLAKPRALIEIDGANHYALCNIDNPPGAPPDSAVPTLSQRASGAYACRWIGHWLRARLNKDPWARLWIERMRGSLDGVVKVKAELSAR